MEKALEYSKKLLDIYAGYSQTYLDRHKIETATEAELQKWEAEIGTALPNDYRSFLLNNDYEFSIGSYRIHSLTMALRDWESMCEHLQNSVFDDGRIERHVKENFGNWDGDFIQKVWWSKKWIPFASDGCGNMYCIDLDPGKNGKIYQIISMEIQDGQGPFINNMFSNFTGCLKKNLDYLQAGKFYMEDYGDDIKMPVIDFYM